MSTQKIRYAFTLLTHSPRLFTDLTIGVSCRGNHRRLPPKLRESLHPPRFLHREVHSLEFCLEHQEPQWKSFFTQDDSEFQDPKLALNLEEIIHTRKLGCSLRSLQEHRIQTRNRMFVHNRTLRKMYIIYNEALSFSLCYRCNGLEYPLCSH